MDQPSKYKILLYYCYTPLENIEEYAAAHLKFCKSIGLKGRVIVAPEGINGTVSGDEESCNRYMEHFRNDPQLSKTDFKIADSNIHAFEKMHVRFKPEIVHSGIRNAEIDPNQLTGQHISGHEFLKLKEEEDVLILDVRSNYEHKVGRFKNALTLDIENFRDFPEQLSKLEEFKDKKIITYCTGGIKCEKASALLLKEGFKNVFQLHGGIIKYAEETGGKDFDGVCYVFDNRVTVPVNKVNPSVISSCELCGTQTYRMINCANPECNEHIPVCEPCGEKMEGACSEACKTHPRKRPYDGTGYYVKKAV